MKYKSPNFLCHHNSLRLLLFALMAIKLLFVFVGRENCLIIYENKISRAQHTLHVDRISFPQSVNNLISELLPNTFVCTLFRGIFFSLVFFSFSIAGIGFFFSLCVSNLMVMSIPGNTVAIDGLDSIDFLCIFHWWKANFSYVHWAALVPQLLYIWVD